MMAEKALLFQDHDTYDKIMAESSPGKQKAFGRKVRGFKDKLWKQWRYQIVLQASYAKFTQNKRLKEILLSTKGKTLVEASPSDRIWGVGLRASDPRIKKKETWRGLNLLGYALTETRERIQKEITEADTKST